MDKIRRILVAIAIPLIIALFALYETIKELKMPDIEELNYESGVIDRIDFYKESTDFTFANNPSRIFISNYPIDQTLVAKYLKEMTNNDTFKIGFVLADKRDSSKSVIKAITIHKNGIPIVSYQNYVDMKRHEANIGPLFAFYIFSGIVVLISFLVLMIPKWSESIISKTRRNIIEKLGAKEISQNNYELFHNGHRIFLWHEFNLEFSQYGNKDLLRVYVEISHLNNVRVQKELIKQKKLIESDGLYYLETVYDNNNALWFSKKRFIKKVERSLRKFNQLVEKKSNL